MNKGLKEKLLTILVVALALYFAAGTVVGLLVAGLAQYGWVYPLFTLVATVLLARIAYRRLYSPRRTKK